MKNIQKIANEIIQKVAISLSTKMLDWEEALEKKFGKVVGYKEIKNEKGLRVIDCRFKKFIDDKILNEIAKELDFKTEINKIDFQDSNKNELVKIDNQTIRLVERN
jgi:hypothetical protein